MTRLRSGEIGGVGDFFEHLVSGDEADVMARTAQHLGVVGGFFAVRPGAVGGEDGVEVKGLRCLDAVEAGAGDVVA